MLQLISVLDTNTSEVSIAIPLLIPRAMNIPLNSVPPIQYKFYNVLFNDRTTYNQSYRYPPACTIPGCSNVTAYIGVVLTLNRTIVYDTLTVDNETL